MKPNKKWSELSSAMRSAITTLDSLGGWLELSPTHKSYLHWRDDILYNAYKTGHRFGLATIDNLVKHGWLKKNEHGTVTKCISTTKGGNHASA